MDPVRSLNGVLGSIRVNERNAGKEKKDAEAFRRALEQEAGGARDGDGKPGRETPLRTSLQQKAAASRRVDGTTPRHVDVIA